ncbi:MAG TPA: XdhC family protein [Gemmatimonadaceae bacterium]
MSTDIYATAARLRAGGAPFVIATVVASWPPQSVRPGAKAIMRADGTLDGWVGGGCVRPVVLSEAAEALRDGRPRLVRMNAGASEPAAHGDVREYPMTCQGEGGVEIYLEPVLAVPRLVVLGHTPVAQSVARLGAELGFDVVTVSVRTGAEPWPVGARVADGVEEALVGADASTWVVVATMGAGDEEALAAAAASDAAYVGLVASRKKGRFLTDYARASGVPAERVERVKYPAGINIGGMSASEIALSIVAEIVRLRHERSSGDERSATRRETGAGRAGSEPDASAAMERSLRALAMASFPIDPVCGMPVNPAEARYTLEVAGDTIFFCCQGCKTKYERTRRAPGAGT